MKNKEFNELILSELRELKADVKEVRQTDVPSIHTEMAVLKTELKNVKKDMAKESDRKAKIYGGVGAAISTMISIAIAHFRK